MTSSCKAITRLERQATRYKRSVGLQVEARAERETQLEAMGAEVEKLSRALEEGVMQAVVQGMRC